MADIKMTARREVCGAAVLPRRLMQLVDSKIVPTTAITQVVYCVTLGDGLAALDASDEHNQVATEYDGIVLITAGAAIAKGAQIMPQASGEGKAVTAAGGTAVPCGIAIQAAGRDGDQFYARLYARRDTALG